MKFISIFSGIEAASVAWKDLDFEAVAFSEILPFQNEVLKYHYPNVPNLGDITKIDWNGYSADLVVGGSPCQSFSVAAAWKEKRGLSGASGLMFEYIRCVKEVSPKYFLWENVPQALTSEDGRAFATLLKSMSDLGYSMSWRILDASNFGSPQMRRRVFVLGAKNSKVPPLVMFDDKICFGENKQERERERVQSWGIRGGTMGRNDEWKDRKMPYPNCEKIPTITSTFMPNVIVTELNGTSVHSVTKTEMERAFGFPDGYVQNVPFNGSLPSHRMCQFALGNSFCIAPVRWIGRRLEKIDKLLEQ